MTKQDTRQRHKKRKDNIGESADVPSGMVLIPSREFLIGSNDPEASSDEQPVHTVYLDAFYMDKYEVTNAEYATFLNTKGKHAEGGIRWFDLKDSEKEGLSKTVPLFF